MEADKKATLKRHFSIQMNRQDMEEYDGMLSDAIHLN